MLHSGRSPQAGRSRIETAILQSAVRNETDTIGGTNMPRRTDVPARYRDKLPQHARDIYVKAYNNAYDQYRDKSKRRGDVSLETVSNKVAWKAVETKSLSQ